MPMMTGSRMWLWNALPSRPVGVNCSCRSIDRSTGWPMPGVAIMRGEPSSFFVGSGTAAANFERLALRNVLQGEVRIFGVMKAIECTSAATRLVIDTDKGPVRVRGGSLDTMDFVSYRADIQGGIVCGPQAQAPPVLVTYRPELEAGTAGEVIIVEVVPVGYKPPDR